jgi:hypothetical protein
MGVRFVKVSVSIKASTNVVYPLIGKTRLRLVIFGNIRILKLPHPAPTFCSISISAQQPPPSFIYSYDAIRNPDIQSERRKPHIPRFPQ